MSDDLQTYHHKFSVDAYNRAADILFADAPSEADIEAYLLDQINRIGLA